MEFHTDALKFGELSSQYREQVANKDSRATETLREIRALISFNSERLVRAFKLSVFKKKSGFDTGRGIPLIANSINTIIAKGDALKMRDLTTLNVRQERKITGVNLLLDYSGSMWFNAKTDGINGLMRIYAQNFTALVLAAYLQKVSNNNVIIRFNCFCETSIAVMVKNVMVDDIDTLIVHSHWASGCDIDKKLLPKLLPPTRWWYQSEHVNEAVTDSITYFRSQRVTRFINLFLTDGGCHRLGETSQDRGKFLQTTFMSVAKNAVVFIIVIAKQTTGLIETAKEIGIKSTVVNTKEEYNDVFKHIFSIVTQSI